MEAVSTLPDSITEVERIDQRDEIDATDLVPSDILGVEAADRIPADLRLSEAGIPSAPHHSTSDRRCVAIAVALAAAGLDLGDVT